jgi:lambda family phage minor tail protein L
MSRESNHKVNSELFSLEPSALLEFFVIYYDYVNYPDEKLYIHGGTNGIDGSIYWQDEEYAPFPIQSSGFESKGDGTLPRPKLMVSNQDFFVSNLIRRYNNLVGAKVVRKRTFLKFLDNRNFSDGKNPYGSADPKSGLEDQVFFILRRSSENRAIVEFELGSPLELENVNFPRRIVMSRYCSFHYRGNGCRYDGPPVSDDSDRVMSTATSLKLGMVKRVYSAASLTEAPANTTEFSEKIEQATLSLPLSDILDEEISVSDTTYQFREFLMYFKVEKEQSGGYVLGCDGDDSFELFVNGELMVGRYNTGPALMDIVKNRVDLETGRQYAILTTGDVNWTSIGASSNTVGTIFVKNATAATGTGTAYLYEPLESTYKHLDPGYHKVLIRWYNKTGNGRLRFYYKYPSDTGLWAIAPKNRFYSDAYELPSLKDPSIIKSFWRASQTSVALNKSTLDSSSSTGSNRNKWELNSRYVVGDYVYRENKNVKVMTADVNDPINYEPLKKWFLCVEEHVSSITKDPFFNKQYWIADQCSKTVTGCKARFGNRDGLPFGGFPGTEEYAVNSQ